MFIAKKLKRGAFLDVTSVWPSASDLLGLRWLNLLKHTTG